MAYEVFVQTAGFIYWVIGPIADSALILHSEDDFLKRMKLGGQTKLNLFPFMRLCRKKSVDLPKMNAIPHTFQGRITRYPNITVVQRVHQSIEGPDAGILSISEILSKTKTMQIRTCLYPTFPPQTKFQNTICYNDEEGSINLVRSSPKAMIWSL